MLEDFKMTDKAHAQIQKVYIYDVCVDKSITRKNLILNLIVVSNKQFHAFNKLKLKKCNVSVDLIDSIDVHKCQKLILLKPTQAQPVFLLIG